MRLIARLTGPFRLETENGTDLTPHSSKVCGLLLLLLTSPNGSRERGWVQDKLWSDRGKDQAAGSLRQAIYQCRKALTEYQDLLTSSKLRVALDLSRIDIATSFYGDFAEGIDVRDPEFEDWLTLERSNRANAIDRTGGALIDQNLVAAAPQLTLAIETDTAADPLVAWFNEVIADQCATLLTQVIGASVVVAGAPSNPDTEFRLALSSVEGNEGWVYVRARLSEAPSALQVWSGHRRIKFLQTAPGFDDDILQMVFEVAETIRLRFSQRPPLNGNGPPVLSSKAISSMFAMTEKGADIADRLLAAAFEDEPSASHLAWRAQIRVIQYFERYKGGVPELLEESRALSAHALERDPNNGMVLALAANTLNHLEGRLNDALNLASRAVDLNPGNPFAWWTLAAAQLSKRDLASAYASALKARTLFRGSTLEFLPESVLGGAALAMGQEENALRHFEQSLSSRSTFKPSLRYALGLNAKLGNMGRAQTLAQELKLQENGFRPDQLIEDGQYPTSLLRLDASMDIRVLRDLAV